MRRDPGVTELPPANYPVLAVRKCRDRPIDSTGVELTRHILVNRACVRHHGHVAAGVRTRSAWFVPNVMQ
jgi:hypothetical protein